MKATSSELGTKVVSHKHMIRGMSIRMYESRSIELDEEQAPGKVKHKCMPSVAGVWKLHDGNSCRRND